MSTIDLPISRWGEMPWVLARMKPDIKHYNPDHKYCLQYKDCAGQLYLNQEAVL